MTGHALGGLVVVELGEDLAVPYAGKILAELGADVVKVERARGDESRRRGPFPPGREGGPEHSGTFAFLNGGKVGMTVPDKASMQECLKLLDLRHADVVLADERFLAPDFAESVAAVHQALPSAVLVTITPFGTTGPKAKLRGYDLTAAAAGGIAYGVGEPDRAPLPLPYAQSDLHAGLAAGLAALMGVLGHDGRITGEHVDLSVQELMASLHCGYFLPRYVFGGGIVGRRAGLVGGSMPYPNTVMACRDGHVSVMAPKLDQWKRLLALMGNPKWASLPRYRDRRAMQWEYKDEVDALVAPWFADKTKAELLELFLVNRLPFAPILGPAEILRDDHLAARNGLRDVAFASGETFTGPATPYRFSRSTPRFGAPPAAGSTSAELSALRSRPQVRTLPLRGSASSQGPLTGLRVLDLGTAWAGGIAGRILADHGAEVLKIESFSHMDGSRMGKPILVDDAKGGDEGSWPDLQPGFHVHGRNKESVTLNLRTPGGRALLLRLAAESDVLIHNFPARVLRTLDLDEQRLLAVNPRLIVVGQSVAGSHGPLADYTGYATTVAALGGLLGGIGYDEDTLLGMFEGIYSDVLSALTTVFAALAALVERLRSERGQAIDVSQWEATLAVTAEPLLDYAVAGRPQRPAGFAHPRLSPHVNVRCLDAEESQWLSVAVGGNDEWAGLLQVTGIVAALGVRARTWSRRERIEHKRRIEDELASWARDKDVDAAAGELSRAGVAAHRVSNIADIFVDEQLLHRGTFISLEHPLVGIEPMPGLAWRFRRFGRRDFSPAPRLGADTRAALARVIAVDDREYEALVSAGAIETAG